MAEEFIESMSTQSVTLDEMDKQAVAIASLPSEVAIYETLLAKKNALKAEAEKIDAEIKKQSDRLCQMISEAGMQNYSYQGYTYTPGTQHKYYLVTAETAVERGIEDRFAPFEEDEALCSLVHKDINWRSMQTALKELEETEEGIPPAVLDVLNISDEFGISRRKANTKNAEKVAAALKRREK